MRGSSAHDGSGELKSHSGRRGLSGYLIKRMVFSIVTPSYSNLSWLKLCIESVADQGVEHEHIVQDSCSDDGTAQWLAGESRVAAVVEKDQGMYDAINRGFRRAQGQILAYLNCDEQYLPGALQKVESFFAQHPKVDMLLSDCLVLDGRGGYICYRRAVVPKLMHTLVGNTLSYLTAGAFIRRRVVLERELLFDPSLKAKGDREWTLRLLRAGVRMAVLRQFTSVFTDTGAGLNLTPIAQQEGERIVGASPRWLRAMSPLLVVWHRLRRLAHGAYFCRSHEYSVYTLRSPKMRQVFTAHQPTFLWPGRFGRSRVGLGGQADPSPGLRNERSVGPVRSLVAGGGRAERSADALGTEEPAAQRSRKPALEAN
jgi:hypothetical protein